MVTQEKKPFQSIIDDDDSDLVSLANEKGVARLTPPEKIQKNNTTSAKPMQAHQAANQPTPRANIRPIKLDVPDYVWEELKIKSVTERCSMRHIIMKALKENGFKIKDEDMIEDGRTLRGKKKTD